MAKPASATKYFQLAHRLRRQIRGMAPGSEMPTVQQLMRDHEVSQGTVVKALEQIRNEGMIYRPAGKKRLIVSEKHDRAVRRVTVIRPDWPSPDIDTVIRSVVQAGKQRGWAFETASYGSMNNVDLDQITGNSDAAVFLANSESVPDHLRAALSKPSKPTTLVLEPITGLGVSTVAVDGRQVGRMAVDYLSELGHTNILAVLSEPPSQALLDRIEGWREAMLERGMGDKVGDLFVDCGTRPMQYGVDVAYEYLSTWMSRPHADFTAIFCDCWTGALAINRILRERGISVPDEVSIIAYAGEGGLGPYLNPPLSTIEVDMTLFGQTVVDQLEHALTHGAAKPESISFHPQLRPRESTAPLHEIPHEAVEESPQKTGPLSEPLSHTSPTTRPTRE